MQLVAPLYSTLLQFDPHEFPKIIGDETVERDDGPTTAAGTAALA